MTTNESAQYQIEGDLIATMIFLVTVILQGGVSVCPKKVVLGVVLLEAKVYHLVEIKILCLWERRLL